ncbi:hypothetical protein D030_4950B, partial [Vibrio parahaemolyticus AQ3810]
DIFSEGFLRLTFFINGVAIETVAILLTVFVGFE